MKKVFLTLFLALFVSSLFGQITAEDNQKEINYLKKRLAKLKSENNKLKIKNSIFEEKFRLQGIIIDSIAYSIRLSNNGILSNTNSIGNTNNQLKQISKTSGDVKSDLKKSSIYFTCGLLVLLILIIIVLIWLNFRRKKEIEKVSNTMIHIEADLEERMNNISKTWENKLLNCHIKVSSDISQLNKSLDKKTLDIKGSIQENIVAFESMVTDNTCKLQNDLNSKIKTVENKTDKSEKGIAKEINEIRSLFEKELDKLKDDTVKQIENLAKAKK